MMAESAKAPFVLIADASEITGLPRDNFEAHEISEEAFKEVGSR
jgi:hypothetical protein